MSDEKIREPHVKSLLDYLLKPTSVFYDIGANVGEYTEFAYKRHVSDIYAFEPDPRNFKTLSAVAEGMNNVTVMQQALGQRAQTLSFSIMDNPHCSGFKFKAERPALRKVDVHCAPLRDFSFTAPDVIKIDTEGYELPIMLGMSPEQLQATIILETHLPPAQGDTIRDLVGFAHAHGKIVYRLAYRRQGAIQHKLLPVTTDDTQGGHLVFF